MGMIGKAAPAAAVAVFLACTAAAPADPLDIRIGWATAPTHMQPLIDALQKRHPELFPHFGKSYTAEGVHFRGSTPQIEALAVGELEIAAFGPPALALAVTNAKLDVRMVADVFQDGVPGTSSIHFVVLPNSPIHKVEDLKGRRVGTNAIGSFGDTAMRVMLHKHGITDSDIISVETDFGNMPAMLDAGKVDMINLLPRYNNFVKEGKYRVLFRGVDGEGRVQAQIWAMRADFIAAHRPALIDFFEDHIRAVRYLLDPAHHEEAVALASAVTKLPPKDLEYMYTADDNYHAPDALPDIPATQRAIDNDVALGILKKRIVVSPNYVDLSLVKEAEQRIKTAAR